MRVPVGVLISGSGTNLQALLDAAAAPDFPAEIAVVIANRADAYGLERARAAGVPTRIVPHRGRSREDFEADLLHALDAHGVEWVALAGFMRLLTGGFLGRYPGRVLNIHPALLPAFPGTHAQEQAWKAGVRIAGATVHLVDEGTDTGPIILQGAVGVRPDEDCDALKDRILAIEHQLYPRALRWAAEGRLHLEDGRLHLDLPDGEQAYLFVGDPG